MLGGVGLRVTITDVAGGGAGLGRLPDGRVAFVDGAIPGDEVEVAVTLERRGYVQGEIGTLLHSGQGRVPATCPTWAAGCGGCAWQPVGQHQRLVLAERMVRDTLRRLAEVANPPLRREPSGVPASGYRTTLHLAVDAVGRVAYHRHRGLDLVEAAVCEVAHESLAPLLPASRLPGVRAVTFRVGTSGGERLAVLDRPSRPGAARTRRRDSVGWSGEVAWSLPPDVVVVGPSQHAWVHEHVAGSRWRVSARSFFQSGPAAAEALVASVDRAVGDALEPGQLLIDAYAGVGLLGGVVARRRHARLLAVEAHPEAVVDARHNLRDLDATVVSGQVGQWAAQPADVVIADPARPGLGRPGVAALTATGARRLVLASCDPASLARDVVLLDQAGYRLRDLVILDLFPGTVHTETVARFDRC